MVVYHANWGGNCKVFYEEVEYNSSSFTLRCYHHPSFTTKGCDDSVGHIHNYGSYDYFDDAYHERVCSTCGYSERTPHDDFGWAYNPTTHHKYCDICQESYSFGNHTSDPNIYPERLSSTTHKVTCGDCGFEMVIHNHTISMITDLAHTIICTTEGILCKYQSTENHNQNNTSLTLTYKVSLSKPGQHDAFCTHPECLAANVKEIFTATHTKDNSRIYYFAENEHANPCIKDCGHYYMHLLWSQPVNNAGPSKGLSGENEILEEFQGYEYTPGRYADTIEEFLEEIAKGSEYTLVPERVYKELGIIPNEKIYSSNNRGEEKGPSKSLQSGTHTYYCLESGCSESYSEPHTLIYLPASFEEDYYHVIKCAANCGYMETVYHDIQISQYNNNTHKRVCVECSYIDYVNHTFVSEYNNNTHWIRCTGCNYITGNESHSLTLTGDSSGHFYSCGCGYQTSPVSHSYGSWSQHNSAMHKQSCSCGYINYEYHNFGNYISISNTHHKRTCSVSGCTYPEQNNHTIAVSHLPANLLSSVIPPPSSSEEGQSRSSEESEGGLESEEPFLRNLEEHNHEEDVFSSSNDTWVEDYLEEELRLIGEYPEDILRNQSSVVSKRLEDNNLLTGESLKLYDISYDERNDEVAVLNQSVVDYFDLSERDIEYIYELMISKPLVFNSMSEYERYIEEEGGFRGTPSPRFGSHYFYCQVDCGYDYTGTHNISYSSYSPDDATFHWVSCDTVYDSKSCNFGTTEPHLQGVTVIINGNYYYSCVYCGLAYQPHSHQYVYTNNPANGNHKISCSYEGCNYSSSGSHYYPGWTYNDINTHKSSCSSCGNTTTANHSLTYTYQNNGTHNRSCATCNYTQNLTCSSYDGYVPQNSTKHILICDYCNSQSSEEHLNYWGPWVDKGLSGHQRTCNKCQYTTTIASHGYTAWSFNNTSTHIHTCTTCNATETANHNITGYTNLGNGYHRRTCSGCGNAGDYSHSSEQGYVSVDINNHKLTCDFCGNVATTAHTYGSWTSISTTQHKRTCSTCGFQALGSHVLGGWTSSSTTQHKRTCNTCPYSETANHTLGSYTSISTTQHNRTCTACGYQEAASSHTFGSYTSISTTQHRRTCTACGYLESASNHSIGGWSSLNGSQHIRSCSICGYSELGNHSGTWVSISSSQHRKTCSTCGFQETASHGISTSYYNGTYHQKSCSTCGYSEYFSHGWGGYTYYSTSQHRRYCSGCGGYEYSSHVFSGSYCTKCGWSN